MTRYYLFLGLFLWFFINPIDMSAQHFYFNDFAKVKNLNDVEGLMFSKSLRNTKRDESYNYFELVKQFFDDPKNCNWKHAATGKLISSKKSLLDAPFKNYKLGHIIKNDFAKKYNSVKKIAESFIHIEYLEYSANNNCDNLFIKEKETLSLEIQFNDKDDYEFLMNEIIKNSTYKDTFSDFGSPHAIYRYEQGKKIENGESLDIGIKFIVHEDDESGYVAIYFNSINRNY